MRASAFLGLVAVISLARRTCGYEEMDPWFRDEWRRATQLKPGLIGTHTFKSERTDLCEVNMDPKKCWEGRTRFQQSIVVDTGKTFGRVLYLDCEPQSSEGDEHIYHEALVHPGMVAHGSPRKVFIAGGGEGATAREVLRHTTVEKLVMVDLDDGLVKISEKHLPYWKGVKDDSRFTLHIGDAVAWLREHDDVYDVIIMDLPDCTNQTHKLYLPSVFELVRSRLSPDGVVTSHAGGDICSARDQNDCRYLPMMARTWSTVFGSSSPALSPMPLWMILHGFMYSATGDAKKPHELEPQEVDERLARLLGSVKDVERLKYYSGDLHKRMFSMRPDYQEFIQSEKQMLDKWDDSSSRKPTPLVECSCNASKCLDEDGKRGPLNEGQWKSEDEDEDEDEEAEKSTSDEL